jgi:hypothetical protein
VRRVKAGSCARGRALVEVVRRIGNRRSAIDGANMKQIGSSVVCDERG